MTSCNLVWCIFAALSGFLLVVVVVDAAKLGGDDLALAAYRLQLTDASSVKDYRFYVGSDCQVPTDCFGGGCLPDPQRPGLKACVCLPGQFNFQILPGFGLCLKCRDLTPQNNWCFFDQECSCADPNAFCQGAAPPQTRGRCACKPNFYALPTNTGEIRCGTGNINSECQSNDQCANIRTLDSTGNRIPPALYNARMSAQCTAPSTALSPLGTSVATSKTLSYAASNIQAGQPGSASATSGGVLVAHSAGGGRLSLSTTNGAGLSASSVSVSSNDALGNVSHSRLNDYVSGASASSSTSGSSTCQCAAGFTPSQDGFECRDIDECQPQFRIGRAESQFVYPASGPALACTVNGRASGAVRCKNLIGGYECECASHFGLQLAQGGLCCEDGNVPCLDGSQCVPFSALCNGVPDCPNDCSDERYTWCMFNSYNPPPNYATYPQCRRTDGVGGPAVMDGAIGQTPSISATLPPQIPQPPPPPPLLTGGDIAVPGGVETPAAAGAQRQAKSLLPADDNFVLQAPNRSSGNNDATGTALTNPSSAVQQLSNSPSLNSSAAAPEQPSPLLPDLASSNNSSLGSANSTLSTGTPAFSATALGANNSSRDVNATVPEAF